MFFSIIRNAIIILLLACAVVQAQTLGTCAAAVGINSQAVSINVTAGQGIVVFYKGIGNDPGLKDPTHGINQDSQGNTYLVCANGNVATASNNCEQCRYTASAASTGTITLTAPGPGIGLNNFIKACPITTFGTTDVCSGNTYTAGNTALTNVNGTNPFIPSASGELVLGDFYIESGNNITPSFSGASSDPVDSMTTSDISAGSATSSTQLTGLSSGSSTASTNTAIQRAFTTSAQTPINDALGVGFW